ncbi:MAG TPA: alpha/beta hydrolase, partial [Dehalococcoidia bacterium]|nr:alpha/beta hydrolase [Dehalococcoidia bacterium]
MISKELQAIISVLKSQPALGELSIEELRATIEANAMQFHLPQDVECQPVDARGVPAEWVTTPESVQERFIYYLHGGGYVAGSISTHREIAWRLSRAAKAPVLTIGYRLAPENPFPAAVEDAIAGYRWLLSQGVDATQVVIAGESAGGGLVMATLVALRDAGEPLPAAAVCVSPWVDLECTGKSAVTKVNLDPLVNRDGLFKNAKDYLGNTDPRTPLASPIYADLTGLPPLLIQVGTAEVLFDDATRLAER